MTRLFILLLNFRYFLALSILASCFALWALGGAGGLYPTHMETKALSQGKGFLLVLITWGGNFSPRSQE